MCEHTTTLLNKYDCLLTNPWWARKKPTLSDGRTGLILQPIEVAVAREVRTRTRTYVQLEAGPIEDCQRWFRTTVSQHGHDICLKSSYSKDLWWTKHRLSFQPNYISTNLLSHISLFQKKKTHVFIEKNSKSIRHKNVANCLLTKMTNLQNAKY